MASLSRLKLTDEEKEQYATEISGILKYVDQIQEVTENVSVANDSKRREDIAHRNVMRDDSPNSLLNPFPQQLVEAAPNQQDNLVKVKKILG